MVTIFFAFCILLLQLSQRWHPTCQSSPALTPLPWMLQSVQGLLYEDQELSASTRKVAQIHFLKQQARAHHTRSPRCPA